MSTTFKPGFYPTPDAVINIMLSGLDFKHQRSFLDPSAGEGHILEAIARRRDKVYRRYDGYQRCKNDLFAIEIDLGRQAILREADHKTTAVLNAR